MIDDRLRFAIFNDFHIISDDDNDKEEEDEG